jgi:transcriptional regulator with XRE-family HTH domain
MNTVVKSVASNIKHLREARGMSQSALARQSGIGKATMSEIEACRRNPTLDTLWAVSNVLGVTLGDLIGDESGDQSALIHRSAMPSISGQSVDALLLDRLVIASVVLEVYSITLRPVRQVSPAHVGKVIERFLVTAGSVRLGPASAPVEATAGDYVTFAATMPHIYEAISERASGVLVMEYTS